MATLSINHHFPRPTPDEKAVLSCTRFTLTNEQREKITSINFNHYLEEYLSDHNRYNQFEQDVADGVLPIKVAGAVVGALAGGGLVAGGVALTCPHPAAIAAGGVVGGVAGGVGGWHLAKACATSRVRASLERTLENSVEFRLWKNEQYKEVFPLLARALPQNALEVHQSSLECPINLEWMQEPVITEDDHVYEKSAIEAHLQQWAATWSAERLNQLTPQEQENALRLRSPLRICEINVLTQRDDYYDRIFKELKDHYNAQVRHVLENIAVLEQPISEEVQEIVDFYSKTEEERSDVVMQMNIAVMRKRLRHQEKVQILSLLDAALEPPILLP